MDGRHGSERQHCNLRPLIHVAALLQPLLNHHYDDDTNNYCDIIDYDNDDENYYNNIYDNDDDDLGHDDIDDSIFSVCYSPS